MFISQHNDCCQGVGIPANPTNLDPAFERDLLRSTLHATSRPDNRLLRQLRRVTPRFDVGVAVLMSTPPSMRAWMLRFEAGVR
jgi:hypothetical protein